MKIDEVIEEARRVRRAALSEAPGGECVLAIYMDYDYHFECCREITERREVSPLVFEFYQEGTIAGYAVHLVVPSPLNCETAHPPFRVVDITPGD